MQKTMQKILAIFLIFTLTFAYPAIVTQTFAASIFDGISKGDTGSNKVLFGAGFDSEVKYDGRAETSFDVNNKDAVIVLKLNVKDEGYLKNGKIQLVGSENGGDPNFVLKAKTEDLSNQTEYVEGIENNTISLKQIDNGSEISISVPIEFNQEKMSLLSKFDNKNYASFTGTYVDIKGNEKSLSKMSEIEVKWTDSRVPTISTEVVKYIPYNTGIIIQTQVDVDNSAETNIVPLQKSNVTIDLPLINGNKPSDITVVPTTLKGTNGTADEKVTFSESNYHVEDNKLYIQVENNEQTYQVEKTSINDLVDVSEQAVEEQRVYSESGKDSYVITYTYNDTQAEAGTKISYGVAAENDFYGEAANTSANISYEYSLEDKVGEIVSANIVNTSSELSKSYLYLNHYNGGQYAINVETKTVLDVSYHDIVNTIAVNDGETYYTHKDGSTTPTEDFLYESVSVTKENFDKMIGEEGRIKILDEAENEIGRINKESEVDENGNIVVYFENPVKKVNYNVNNIISEGNLIINENRTMVNNISGSAEIRNLSSVNFEKNVVANYTYVSSDVEIGKITTSTNFIDTVTKANLVIDRDSLSTLTKNENVEMRIELNNDSEESDVYGNSSFHIAMPEDIVDMKITNAAIAYGEGLDISNANAYEKNGRVYIDVDVAGQQTTLNSGVLSNGCNIVLNADIELDIFTPNKDREIELSYVNDKASSYPEGKDHGEAKATINYSSPTGLVAVNSINGFAGKDSMIASVNQGTANADIPVFADESKATAKIIVMNNNQNTVSNISILGRIPFIGVKDIESGADLGTNVDTKLLSQVTSEVENDNRFKVYYSTNGEATKDLADTNNGWTENVETLDNIKSYLIVPVDPNFKMEAADTLAFKYDYYIPADLEHNAKIYGTFLTYFTNNTEVATVDETSTPDPVGLTTGEGPQLSTTSKLNNREDDTLQVRQYEELRYTVSVKNDGVKEVNNVKVNVNTPQYLTYSKIESSVEGYTATNTEGGVVVNIPQIAVGNTSDVTFVYKATGDASKIGQDNVLKTSIASIVTADRLEKQIDIDAKNIEINQAEIEIKLRSSFADNLVFEQDEEYSFMYDIYNCKQEIMENIKVVMVLPDGFKYKGSTFDAPYVMTEADKYKELTNENGQKYLELDGKLYENSGEGTYNEANNTVEITIPKLNRNRFASIQIDLIGDEISSGKLQEDRDIFIEVSADGTEKYVSDIYKANIGRPEIEIIQTTNNTNTYVEQGNSLQYTFEIRNTGSAMAKEVTLNDIIPEGIIAQSAQYTIGQYSNTDYVTQSGEVTVKSDLDAGETMYVTIDTIVDNLDGLEEKTVSNVGSVNANNIDSKNSNIVTHIIEATKEPIVVEEDQVQANVPSVGAGNVRKISNEGLSRSFRINGIAWLDENKNGKREDSEAKLSNISARLISSDNGEIIKTTNTDSKGFYEFAGITKGNYIVLFEYDTVTYVPTTYKCEGVANNVNSDVISTQYDVDGRTAYGAVTDVISLSTVSLSNVDIGLAYAKTFDLSLEKTVTKVTTYNDSTEKSNTNNFKNEKLVQVPIKAKYINNTTVYIEYTITVKNNGDIAGYAKQIVDYVPEGMTYNSSLNTNWYTGSDGYLYTSQLENTEIKPHESATVKLVLEKKMNSENTSGIVNNQAEITNDYNIYGISDVNSTVGNKKQGENDISSADVLITINTGDTLIYLSVIITTLLIGGTIVFLTYTKLVVSKRKGGV